MLIAKNLLTREASYKFSAHTPHISSVEATRELCDDLESLIEIAKQSRAPIRAVCLIERARGDLEAYLGEIHQAEVSSAWSGLG